jgi:hypothetical protein
MPTDLGQPRIKWLGVGINRQTWERERADGTTETISALWVTGKPAVWTASVSVACDTREQAEAWLEEQRGE